jgi:lipoyl-dependent peroxiredoxin subunit D
MSPLEELRQSLPEFARDIKLTLGTLLGPDGVPELTTDQKWGSAVAAAIAARHPMLTQAVEQEALLIAGETTVEAARIAAAIMAMTNVYYRAVHMADDPELSRMLAGLRMIGLTRHGTTQGAFELFGLAASAVKGCEGCLKAHIAGARRQGIGSQAIQASLRIAAVLHAAATVLDAAPAPVLGLPFGTAIATAGGRVAAESFG